MGDVHPDGALEVAGALTPVPGGVGPLTIAMLLKNTLIAARHRRSMAVDRSRPTRADLAIVIAFATSRTRTSVSAAAS